MSKKQIVIDEQVSLIGPDLPMLGPVESGATVVVRSAPGCWGPMITPEIVSGHEVSQPVAIEGAQPGDAIAVKIKSIRILGLGAMSGSDRPIPGRWVEGGDPATFAQCPKCKAVRPKTVVEGIGPGAIRCAVCGEPMIPFEPAFGYTAMFDEDRRFALTVDEAHAKEVAKRAYQYAALPAGSIQNPATLLGTADLVGVWARLRPFIGNLGVVPAIEYPAMKNTRDIAVKAVGSTFEYGLKEEDLSKFADCHLDCADVRPGAIYIMPVKVPGAGLYMGDVHAVQGAGEIAGHTLDVSAEVVVEVELLKGLSLEDCILLPNYSDLPEIARPLSAEEKELVERTAARLGLTMEEEVLPFQVIGTGRSLNEALVASLERMSKLTGLSYDEVRNRCTIAGDAKMARSNGVMQLTMLTPVSILKKIGIYDLVNGMYGSAE